MIGLKIFPGWNKMSFGSTKAYCTLCKKSFSVAALGITALHIYAKGSKHPSHLPSPTQSTLNFQFVKNVLQKQSNTINSLKFYD